VPTALIVVVLIVVVLLFIGLPARFITRRVEQAEGRDTCSFCGAALEQGGLEFSPICPACDRRQPWDTDDITP
jgi:hypothetical protein